MRATRWHLRDISRVDMRLRCCVLRQISALADRISPRPPERKPASHKKKKFLTLVLTQLDESRDKKRVSTIRHEWAHVATDKGSGFRKPFPSRSPNPASVHSIHNLHSIKNPQITEFTMKSRLLLIGLASCFATYSQAAIVFQTNSGTTNALGNLSLTGMINTFDTSLGTLNSVTLSLGVDGTSNFTKFENLHDPTTWTVDLTPDSPGKISVLFWNSALGIGVNKDMTMTQNIFSVPTYAGTDYVVPFTSNPVAGAPGLNSNDYNKDSYDLSAFKGDGVTKVLNMEIVYNPNWAKSGPTIGDVDTITGSATVEWSVQYNYTIPEPATSALLGLGGLALVLRRRKA